ncbi:hypothetical protein J5U23_01616 [Saccharolobus shibatae B12]|uniref:Uncharacterized protein n=1 Tax=Saccharolobus shibatae (strain ATCC 51178 / DSM 5389 / JCM 8931 / NBRC 15437 / B12) TaxID=523848 RepID=A0A8F5BNX7_SACSH|nr:hypothetical protein [Saccharolobus shibatae]QXJ28747.1 hypothetical protein J5U23_01616 [Saccharolobus shibatae B12]
MEDYTYYLMLIKYHVTPLAEKIKNAIMAYLQSNVYYPEEYRHKLNWFIRLNKWVIANYSLYNRKGKKAQEVYAYFKLNKNGELTLLGEYWVENGTWMGEELVNRRINEDCIKIVNNKYLCD